MDEKKIKNKENIRGCKEIYVLQADNTILKESKNYLSFKDFCTSIQNLLMEELDNDYQVEINHVIKNNSIQLEGIVILRGDETIAPHIYLNDYYYSYINGLTLYEIVKNIMSEYKNSRIDQDTEHMIESFEFEIVKGKIIYRLVNFNKNKELLKELPHIKFLDLAITFHCLVKDNENGIGTIRITNSHVEKWDITLEKLILCAKENTPILFPATIQSMDDVLINLIQEEYRMEEAIHNFNESYDLYNELKSNYDMKLDMDSSYKQKQHERKLMLILSNNRGINGASCMLYPELMQEIADELESDLYILPSSIHELILIKSNNHMSKSDLKKMVKEINLTQVPVEDVLSDSIYYYSRSRDAISKL